MTFMTDLFVFIEFLYTVLSNIDIEKSLNSVTNEDAEIILIDHRPMFCIHRPGMEWKVF